MNTGFKNKIIWVISVLAVLFAAILILNFSLKNKLKKMFDDLPKTVKIAYKDISVNVLSGHVGLTEPVVSVYGKTTNRINAKVALKSLDLNGFGYFDYFFNDKIGLDAIMINQPKITYFHNDAVKSNSYLDAFGSGLKQAVEIESIQIKDGNIEIYKVSKDSLMLKSEAIDFNISMLEIDQAKNSNPIVYKDFSLICDNLFYMMNDYENLFLEHADFNSKDSKVSGLSIKTKYSTDELSQRISKERDYFNLKIDSVVIKDQDFGFKQDSLFYFKSQRIDFYQPDFKIYRDKLVEDDLSIKPLYSKSLRNLGFSIDLSNVFLKNASIVYTEKVKNDTEGGQLLFSKLNAEIKNLSNHYKNGENLVSIGVDAIFMENTPINVQWDFDVSHLDDAFVFKADMDALKADAMNQFMEPNLNVRLEGEIDKTYFTISGGNHIANIDLKLKYDDFDVIILKQDGKEKNKLLSSLVNLFVSKDSKKKSDSDRFRYGTKEGVERDQTKSVFNYLWLNIKAGLLNAMTGDGKEDKSN
mgnify:CR=1 FL=1|tara:strand:- start:2606 stop:4186 length:1581 start_codon:yes stop_codon:yes gene_type:complete